MKARRFAVGGAQIEQVKTDRGEFRKAIDLTGSSVHAKFPIDGTAVEVTVDPDAFLLAETTVRHQ